MLIQLVRFAEHRGRVSDAAPGELDLQRRARQRPSMSPASGRVSASRRFSAARLLRPRRPPLDASILVTGAARSEAPLLLPRGDSLHAGDVTRVATIRAGRRGRARSQAPGE